MDKSKYLEREMAISLASQTTLDISGKTKAQLKEYATSIGLTVKSSLSKANTLDVIHSSPEFIASEKQASVDAVDNAILAFEAKYKNDK